MLWLILIYLVIGVGSWFFYNLTRPVLYEDNNHRLIVAGWFTIAWPYVWWQIFRHR